MSRLPPPRAALPLANLPEQRQVHCTHPAEVPLLYRQIAPYFKHGICLEAGDCIFDVGANIGLFSLAASLWGEKPLRGFAFEPAPPVALALRANLARYGLLAEPGQAGIMPLACAVGEQPGQLTLHHYPRATVLSTAHPGELLDATTRAAIAEQLQRLPRAWRWLAHLPRSLRQGLVRIGMAAFLRAERYDCPVLTLSQVIAEHAVERIDLLKIDAERAELAVLQGLAEADWPRIRQVVMEVHDTDGRLATVLALLRQHGLSDIATEQSSSLKPFGVWQLWARRPTQPSSRP